MHLITPRMGRSLFDLCEEFLGPPSCSPRAKWVGGVIVPLAFAAYGLCCCLAQRALFVGSERFVANGNAGLAFGVLWISVGAFAHSHYFWGSLERLYVLSEPGKVVSLISITFSAFCMMFFWLATGYR